MFIALSLALLYVYIYTHTPERLWDKSKLCVGKIQMVKNVVPRRKKKKKVKVLVYGLGLSQSLWMGGRRNGEREIGRINWKYLRIAGPTWEEVCSIKGWLRGERDVSCRGQDGHKPLQFVVDLESLLINPVLCKVYFFTTVLKLICPTWCTVWTSNSNPKWCI